MKLGKYDITLKNVKAYVQGKTRSLVERFGGEFIQLEDHVKEQIIWRHGKADKDCIEKGVCYCGCEMPDMLYADKTCEKNCYPVMMDKKTWEDYKANESN